MGADAGNCDGIGDGGGDSDVNADGYVRRMTMTHEDCPSM